VLRPSGVWRSSARQTATRVRIPVNPNGSTEFLIGGMRHETSCHFPQLSGKTEALPAPIGAAELQESTLEACAPRGSCFEPTSFSARHCFNLR
ncbi:MAG: hypothetical protein ACREAC_32430, partial [Blastocatellia bacterium]